MARGDWYAALFSGAFFSIPVSEASREELELMRKYLQIIRTVLARCHFKSSVYCHDLVWLHLALTTIKGKLVWHINPITIQQLSQSLKMWETIWARTARGCPQRMRNNLWSDLDPITHIPEIGETVWVIAKPHLPFGGIVCPTHEVSRKKSETDWTVPWQNRANKRFIECCQSGSVSWASWPRCTNDCRRVSN